VNTEEKRKEMVATMGWRMAEQEWRKGPWTPAEDNLLFEYVRMHGEGRWSSVAGCSGKFNHFVLNYYYRNSKE
jgi:hypothetical protein